LIICSSICFIGIVESDIPNFFTNISFPFNAGEAPKGFLLQQQAKDVLRRRQNSIIQPASCI
jgi:hypothetical protein